MVESGNQIQHRGLPGAGTAEQGDKFPAGNLDGNAIDGADQGVAHPVMPTEIFSSDGRSVPCRRSHWHARHNYRISPLRTRKASLAFTSPFLPSAPLPLTATESPSPGARKRFSSTPCWRVYKS